MHTSLKLRMVSLAAVVVAGLAAYTWLQWGDEAATRADGSSHSLTPVAQAGRPAYDANCAECHGQGGVGTTKGPPIVHEVYNPGHHSDASFARAVQQGVRQHHWRFGDMPTQPQVTAEELEMIVRYVRALQQAHGITFQPHAK